MTTEATPTKPLDTTLVAGVSTFADTVNADLAAVTKAFTDLHLKLIFVLVLILGGVFYIVHRGMESYDKALDKANTANQQFIESLKATVATQASAAKVDATTKTQTIVLEKQIAATDTTAAQATAKVTAPDATAVQVQQMAGPYMGETPDLTPDNKLAFTPPTIQKQLAIDIHATALEEDLASTKQELSITADDANANRAATLQAAVALEQAKSTIGDYKAAAVKSKWARLKGYLITAGIGYGAYEAGKHVK